MEIEVKGIDSLREKLKKLPQILNQATNQAMFEVTETIRSTAEDNAPVGIYTGGGELKGSIHAIVDNEDGKIVGRVWSDKKQAIFTELVRVLEDKQVQKIYQKELSQFTHKNVGLFLQTC